MTETPPGANIESSSCPATDWETILPLILDYLKDKPPPPGGTLHVVFTATDKGYTADTAHYTATD